MTTTTDTRTDAHRQAVAQLESVAAMVAALEVDYDRLQELREEVDSLTDAHDEAAADYAAALKDPHQYSPEEMARLEGALTDAGDDLATWQAACLEELRDLEAAAGDCEDIDDAERAIQEDALSLEIRSAWQLPGEELTPAEYRIVLCTGGPHVEMVGELDEDGGPDTVRILFQDWGETGELFDFNRAAALEYARCIMGA